MPITLLLAAALVTQSAAPITLQVRVFDGPTEVTRETRIVAFRAGDRQAHVAESHDGQPLIGSVPAGFYDVQAIREHAGRVVSIRWVERLVVMAYPDEGGRHLEIVNLQGGFGALEVRGKEGRTPDVAIFPAGNHDTDAGRPVEIDGGVLFVVQAGQYDLRVRQDGATTWHPQVEVPVDRTRFWITP